MMHSMGRGDPSMPTVNLSGWKTLPDEKRVSLGWVAPTVAFAGVVARAESLRGRMSEAGRQVEGLFESLLSESFGE